jgi:hypothetical protein
VYPEGSPLKSKGGNSLWPQGKSPNGRNGKKGGKDKAAPGGEDEAKKQKDAELAADLAELLERNQKKSAHTEEMKNLSEVCRQCVLVTIIGPPQISMSTVMTMSCATPLSQTRLIYPKRHYLKLG